MKPIFNPALTRAVCNILVVFNLVSCGANSQQSDAKTTSSDSSTVSPREARFHIFANRLQELFDNCHSDEDVLKIVDDRDLDLRGNAYRLQALLKLYKKGIGPDGKIVHDEVKALEDALGKYGESREATQFAEKVKAPEAVLTALKERRKDAFQVLLVFLRQQKWVDATPSKASLIQDKFKTLTWPSDEEDRSFFKERLAHEYQKLAETDYPRTRTDSSSHAIREQLEGWTHKMRRDLRWTNLMLGANDGLTQRNNRSCSIPEYAPLSDSPLAKLPFTIWPKNPAISAPILIEDCLYLAFVETIDALGVVKDLAQGAFHLQTGFIASGIESDAEEAMTLALSYAKFQFDPDIFTKTEEIEQKMRKLRLLETMANSIEISE
jgi:hypothetical protein